MKSSLLRMLIATVAGMSAPRPTPMRPNNGSLPASLRWDGPPTYRIAFTARSGRTIVRETQVGSSHERRLLKRRNARRVGT